MTKRFESSFKGCDEAEIFFQAWMVDQAYGTMVVTHGLAEHSECYQEMAGELNAARWNLVGWDLRGHGRSEGKRGYAKSFSLFEEDLFLLIQLLKKDSAFQNQNFVLFGHSMGGLITLKTLIHHGIEGIDGLVLSSPALGLAVAVPGIKDFAAKVAYKWFPTLTLFNELSYRDLTRDEEKIKAYEADTLRHDKICPAIYLGMLEGFEEVFAKADHLQLPLLMVLSGHDSVVSSPQARNFFDKVPAQPKRLEIFPDSLHEVFNDLDRKEAYKVLKNFLKDITHEKATK